MKRNKAVGYIGTGFMFCLAFLLYFSPSIPDAFAGTTTTFSTTAAFEIIGYAIPDAAGLSAALVPFLLPILIAGLLVGLTGYIGLQGDINSFVLKLGLLIGCLLGMLSVTRTNPSVIPFVFPFVAGIYLITYLWKRV